MDDMEIALERIRQYAKDHGLTPEQVEKSFLAGWFAAAMLREDWRPRDSARPGQVA